MTDEFVSFRVDGVKERDIDQFDELCAKLISDREDRNKVRKDGFYFSLFFLKLLDDVTSRQLDHLRSEVREIVRQELAQSKVRETAKRDGDVVAGLTSLDDAPTEEHDGNPGK